MPRHGQADPVTPHILDTGMWYVREPGRASLFGPVRLGRSWAVCRECDWRSQAHLGDGAVEEARSHGCPVLVALRYLRAATPAGLGGSAALGYLISSFGLDSASRAVVLWELERATPIMS
jgi:hypothetical protein